MRIKFWVNLNENCVSISDVNNWLLLEEYYDNFISNQNSNQIYKPFQSIQSPIEKNQENFVEHGEQQNFEDLLDLQKSEPSTLNIKWFKSNSSDQKYKQSILYIKWLGQSTLNFQWFWWNKQQTNKKNSSIMVYVKNKKYKIPSEFIDIWIPDFYDYGRLQYENYINIRKEYYYVGDQYHILMYDLE